MTNVRDIIGDWADWPDEPAVTALLKALRDAAGASATDSITIAADGTVGRLTPTWLSPDPAACQYRVVTP